MFFPDIIIHVNAEGNVTVIVANRTVEELSLADGHITLRAARWNVPDYDGKATVDVENLEVGRYTVEATYNGNDNYNKVTATADFNVIKANTTVSLDVDDIKVGETQVLNITINNTNATGTVVINIDGENYTAEVINGTANFTTLNRKLDFRNI